MIIYGLIDPRNRMIRYVGLASSPGRPLRHATETALRQDTHKSRWILQLIHEGLMYEVCKLETCETRAQLISAEIWWIAFGRACGWPLLNETLGGDGRIGIPHTLETRQKMSASWRPSEYRNFRISEALTGLAFSAERRQNLSVAQQKRFAEQPVSEETRLKISASLLGNQNALGSSGSLIDISGQRFHQLTALVYVGKRDWYFRCDCGGWTIANSYRVRRGLKQDCGCVRRGFT